MLWGITRFCAYHFLVGGDIGFGFGIGFLGGKGGEGGLGFGGFQ